MRPVVKKNASGRNGEVELQAYEAGERFRKLAGARGEEPGMRPVVKKNACGIWVKNALSRVVKNSCRWQEWRGIAASV